MRLTACFLGVVINLAILPQVSAQLPLITGHVIDEKGAPVPGARVVIIGTDQNDRIVGTNADDQGNFRFDDYQTGPTNTVIIGINANGFGRFERAVTLPADGSGDLGEFVLLAPSVSDELNERLRALDLQWQLSARRVGRLEGPAEATITLGQLPAFGNPGATTLWEAQGQALTLATSPLAWGHTPSETKPVVGGIPGRQQSDGLAKLERRIWEELLTPADLRQPIQLSTEVFFRAGLSWNSLNSAAVQSANTDEGPQRKVAVLSHMDHSVVVASRGEGELLAPSRQRGPLLASLINPRAYFTARSADAPRVFRKARGEIAIEVPPSQAPRPASTPGDSAGVKLFFVDSGESSGASVHMTIVNEGTKPVTIAGDAFVLEPVRRLTAKDVAREIGRFRGRQPVTVTIDAYCLDMRKAPPAAGMVMRVAPDAVQATIGPLQKIAIATRVLYGAAQIQPDTDPVAYRHALLQWSIWTLEQKLTEQTFTQAFLDHSKQNIESAGQKWTPALDAAVRKRAPGRWRSIQQVFRFARLPLAGSAPQ